MSHRPHRAHSREEADEGHARSRSSSGGRGMHGHSSASSSSAAAAAVAASSSAAARASSSNPLETLLKDLKCNICLSLARNPISLPCNHFFCDSCLTNMMDSEQERTKSVRKAKKNDSIRLDMHCPNCREVYTRRNIVEDQVLRQMSKLCLQLQKQPDVKELLSTDDSIFDLSQQTPNQSPAQPRRPPTRTNSNGAPLPASSAAASTKHAKSKKKLSSLLDSSSEDQHAHSLASDGSEFQFTSGMGILESSDANNRVEEKESQSSSAANKRGRPTNAAKKSAAAAAASASSSAADPTTPSRSNGLPPRRAALHKKSYKEQETQMEEDELPDGREDGEDDEEGEGESSSSGDESMDGDGRAESNKVGRNTSTPPPSSLQRKNGRTSPTSAPSSSHPPASSSSSGRKKRGYPALDFPPGVCSVCCTPSSVDDEVVQCRECKVFVHPVICYGSPLQTLTAKERQNWYCDRCSPLSGVKRVSCCVCPNTADQAFKKTDRGEWIHASCAQWIPEVRYRDPNQRDCVQHLGKIPRDRWKVPCKFCTEKGAIVQCTYPKCAFAYHVPCGFRHGIVFEIRSPNESQRNSSQQLMSQQMDGGEEEESDDVFFHNFCFKHQESSHLAPSCNSALATSAKKGRKKKKRGREQQQQKKKDAAPAPVAEKQATPAAAAAAATRGEEKSNLRDEKEAADEADGVDHKQTDDDGDDADHPPAKRTKGNDALPVNRSINLADTSMDTSMDSNMDTPMRGGAVFNFRSLISPPSASPFTTPMPAQAQAAAAAAAGEAAPHTPTSATAAAAANTAAVSRRLAFTPPSSRPPVVNNTASFVGTRSSPAKPAFTSSMQPMLRTASAGTMSTQIAPSTSSNSKPALSRPSSLTKLKQQTMSPFATHVATRNSTSIASLSPLAPSAPAAAAAAAASSSHAPAAAAAASSSSSSARAPLRTMARDEVHSRDSHNRNNSSVSTGVHNNSRAPSPSTLVPKSRPSTSVRRNIVLLGTKLDLEQQKLLEELASVLNASAQAAAAGGGRGGGGGSVDKFVSVQTHFDSSVTHVITTANAQTDFILHGRTVKYFQGLLSGCWVVGVDWVTESFFHAQAQNETNFLVRGDAKCNGGEVNDGAKRARNAAQSLDSKERSLFAGCHFVWNGPSALSSNKSIKGEVARLVAMGQGEFRDSFPGEEKKKKNTRQHDDSDMDEEEGGESQGMDLPPAATGASPMKFSSIAGGAGAAGAAAGGAQHRASFTDRGRWFLLVDDTGVKRARNCLSRLRELKPHVTPSQWDYCARNHIEIVGVNWLFDSISAFRLQPTEKLASVK